jgi:hypothetical protein
MIADEVKMNWETIHLILTEELGMRKMCTKIVPRNLTEQQRNEWLSAVFDIEMHHGTLLTHLIMHLVTSFYFKK